MSQAEGIGMYSEDQGEHEGDIDISLILTLNMDEFLSCFELNQNIKCALADQNITIVHTLLACDVSDIYEISRYFSTNKNLTFGDKIHFRQILKNILEQNEREMRCHAKSKLTSTISITHGYKFKLHV